MLTGKNQRLRRGLLICSIALFADSGLQAGNAAPVPVKIQVDVSTVTGAIAPDFIGLGYETAAVAQTNYFSPKNAALIRLYRNLSPHGLIRIGGNISDHTAYVPDGTPAVHPEEGVTIINRAGLVDLGKFARVTGWQVMWGLNLGSGSKDEAIQEALAVNAALGGALQSFEIGNEVDFQPRFKNNYAAYHAAYLDYKAAIRAALPRAAFSGPDVAVNRDWLTAFANTEAHDLKLLTHHYYRSDAHSQRATLELLLQSDEPWAGTLEKLQQTSGAHGVGYRINEVNSFSGGGKTNVSDTFGSALWCLDYMFVLATHGCDGINLETDINQHAWISHYSPIIHGVAGSCRARAEYYGMLAFAMAGHGELLKLTLDKGNINLSAYATKDQCGHLRLTVVNKDLAQDAGVEISLPAGYARAAVFRLTAPSVNSQD